MQQEPSNRIRWVSAVVLKLIEIFVSMDGQVPLERIEQLEEQTDRKLMSYD